MSATEFIYHRSPVWLQNLAFNAYALRIVRHRYGRRYRERVRALNEQERLSANQVREHQDARLRELVAFAYHNTRYYRAVFEERGLRPEDITGVVDLSKLPLLSKEAVRDRAPDLMSRAAPARGWLHGHTSGTTGSPLGLWYDRELCVLNNAVDRQQKQWGGVQESDWLGILLGRVVVSPRTARPPFWRVNWVQRQIWFSSFHMSDANLPLYVAQIRTRGLRFLEGYPSTLYVLARHLVRRGETLPMKAVFSSSETLHSVQRETIESAFQCPLFDFYGLAERVIFAGECEAHEGKHLNEEFGYTEVVDGDGSPVPDGHPGRLVGTSLHNRAMPMIRYLTSDITSILTEPCSCGRPFRRMASVSTKAEDIVVTPDGRMISPSVLTHPFKPYDQIVKSQILQETVDRIVVRIVPSTQFGDSEKTGLLAELRKRLGDEIQIHVEVVDDIPREASGKFRWVISRVQHENIVDWESNST